MKLPPTISAVNILYFLRKPFRRLSFVFEENFMEQKSRRGGVRVGAGRKKDENHPSTTFQFKIKQHELEKLKSRAAAKNMKVSTFVKDILFSAISDS